MNARVRRAKMEAHAQTMLTPTPAPASRALLATTAKPTSLIALKGECIFYIAFKPVHMCIITEYDNKMCSFPQLLFQWRFLHR